MSDLSYDIETLGTAVGSVILSIGAVKFDIVDGTIYDSFYVNIDLWSSLDYGLTIDRETREVWQSAEFAAARPYLKADQKPLPEALDMYAAWHHETIKANSVWAKPPQFDCGLSEEAYRRCNMHAPWHFRAPRCLRTLLDVSEFDEKTIPMQGVKHFALDDAIHQAKVIVAAKKHMSRPVSA